MRILPISIFCLFAVSTHANVIQYFAGISYNNPSELFKIKNDEFLFGTTASYADLAFSGSALNFNTFQYEQGTNHSQTYTYMPYGRIAKRFNEKTVFALDVTEPFNSNLNWGDYAFTRYANTQNYLRDVDISPKFSYALNPKWQIGAGINFNYLLKNEVNWAFPTGATSYATLINPSSSFGLGYNFGVTYLIDQRNFLGLAYYSKIKQKTRGTSSLGANFNPNLSFDFFMPTTIVVNYVHIFNPKWLISITGMQSQWSLNQFVRIYNTAAPAPMSNFVFHMRFDDAYAAVVALRKQVTEKAGLTLVGMVDVGPERGPLRTITFPCYDQYFLGLQGDYAFNSTTSVELLYGHVLSAPGIDNTVTVNGTTIPFNKGNVNINVDVLALKLKVSG